MRKSVKEFFPRLIFMLFFVYVLLLGTFNIFIIGNKSYIENYLVKILDVQSVTIGNISNLPFIFISGTEFTVVVNDELKISIRGVYVQYNILKALSKKFEQIVSNIQIESLTFEGHSVELKKYIRHLKEKFPASEKSVSPEIDVTKLLSEIQTNFFMKQISIKINSMTEFWHTGTINNLAIQMKNNRLVWDSQLNFQSIWSNKVLLAQTSIQNSGVLSNFSSLQGCVKTTINNLNLGGLPFIKKNMQINTIISNGIPNIVLDQTAKQNGIELSLTNGVSLAIKNTLNINYDDFEEYNFLDYAFKPGEWTFSLNLDKIDDWKLNIDFSSPQHPYYGLDINIDSIKRNKLYSVFLNLRTHFFGGLRGDLTLPIRQNLYPLPEGVLHLDNTRFVLNGLIFSGTALASVVSNQNMLDLKVYNVKMNDGLIGDSAVRFAFGKNFIILPQPHPNNAIDISASIGGSTSVDIKAHDINGDFIAKNIKIPIFGIKDSRYRGEVSIYKKDRKHPLNLDGYIKGYLDNEEQIDAIISLQDSNIKIPRFHILSPNILLSGDVMINSKWSNTTINIDAIANFNNNADIPIDIDVNIQKHFTKVLGTVDKKLALNTLTVGSDTDFTIKFPKYNLRKLGLNNIIADALLKMKFTDDGIARFKLQEAKINIENQQLLVDFDTVINTNTGNLDSTKFSLGINEDILTGYGYFSFLENGFGASFQFDRGGSLQFTIGRYVVKSRINLVNVLITNLFQLSALQPISFLNNSSTDLLSLHTDLNIIGPWSDLNIDGLLDLTSVNDKSFQLSLPKLSFSKKHISLQEFRFRHPSLNIDSDITIDIDESQLQSKLEGSFSYDDLVKSDFTLNYKNISNTGILDYDLPNLYALSKKPINIQGTVYHNNNEYLFISKHAKYGLTGTFSRQKIQDFWDISLLNENIRLFSEGHISTNKSLLAKLNVDIFLDQMNFHGPIRSSKGNINITSDAQGKIDNPILNGKIDFEDIQLALRPLRNQLHLDGKQSILISNNQITIPDFNIHAIKGGVFGLTGFIDYKDQSIETANLNLYSKTPNVGDDTAFLNWNIDAPLIRTRTRTYISNITLSGNLNELLLDANIKTEDLNLRLELEDTLSLSTSDAEEPNPLLGILESLNLNINVDLGNKSKFLSQIFNIDFEQIEPIKIQGNIGDGDVVVSGDFAVEKGRVSYLNSDLKVTSGTIGFSKEPGDVFPSIAINTETTQDDQGEILDIFVNFEGKLPDLELANISSSPVRTKSDLLNILGTGSSSTRNQANSGSSGARDLIASGVGIAENTLFTAPLTRRFQQLLPFLDSVQLKTDILGNITRSSGNTAQGLGLFHGTELSVGQYIPGLRGVQANYNFRLESPNSTIDTASLNQIHQAGISWNTIIPVINAQGGLGLSMRHEPSLTPSPANEDTEVIFEGSIRKRF